MTTIETPPALRELFGERQSRRDLLLVFAAMPLPVIAIWPSLTEVEWWRALLAAILVADIAAGAVANLTAGTNAHYAASARRRALFIAVHVHLPLVALLLGWPLLPALVAWATTIAAATVVTTARHSQRVVAGTLLIVGASVTALWPDTTVQLLLVAVMFGFKVGFSFAVDHARTVDDRELGGVR